MTSLGGSDGSAMVLKGYIYIKMSDIQTSMQSLLLTAVDFQNSGIDTNPLVY